MARDLIGYRLRHAGACGRIVETESYHQSEPACHAYVGLTARTTVLFDAPGLAYVYRSYGIHALLNAVCEREGTGAAVLIRALEPLEGVSLMQERRGLVSFEQLCSGPGKLTQALAVTLSENATSLIDGPISLEPPPHGESRPDVVVGPRVGITKAPELPWRFCDPASRCVSRPLPPSLTMRGLRATA